MFILLILGIVNGLYHQQAGVYDWTMRLFGKLDNVMLLEENIIYHGEHHGLINKANGQVLSRNNFIMCDDLNYIVYDEQQKIVKLFNDEYTVLLQQEISPIRYCLNGIHQEFLIITDEQLYVVGDVSFNQQINKQILFAGYLSGKPVLIFKIEDQSCVYYIEQAIFKGYCTQYQEGEFIQYRKDFILQNNVAFKLYETETFNAQIVGDVLMKGNDILDSNGKTLTKIGQNEIVVENNQDSGKYIFTVKKENNDLIVTTYDYESDLKNQINIQVNETAQIRKAFLVDLNGREFVIQFEDLQTIFIEKNKLIWSNEQSAIDIEAVFFENYENEEVSHKNSYYDSLTNNGAHNPLYIVQNTILRITNELNDLKDYLIHHVSNLGQTTQQIIEIEKYYGLRQKMYFLTKYNTILVYDSNSGSLITKYNIKLDQQFKLVAHHQLQFKHYFFFYHNGRLNTFMLDMEHDLIQQVASQNSKSIMWSFPYKIGSSLHNNLIILVDEDHKLLSYPIHPDLKTNEVLLYKQEDGKMFGYMLKGRKLEQIWSLNLMDTVLKIRSSYMQENPRVAIWDDKKVLFKLIDHSNFAILCTDGEKLKLLIVNGKTGKIIFQTFQNEVDFDQPINLIFDEHQVFVSYYNKAQMIYEIWTVEIYHAKIEVSFLKMLENYYFTKTELNINYYQNELQAFFLQQVYGYPLGISEMTISSTHKSLTKKNLLIITPNGQLHSLDRNLISARRREKADQQILDYSLQSAELPPYQYLLPINYQAILTYHQQLDINKFQIQSTSLESSSLLLLYGKDIFLTRIAPDKTYDMMQDDFNYGALLGTILIILIGCKFMSRLTKQAKRIRQFYNIYQ